MCHCLPGNELFADSCVQTATCAIPVGKKDDNSVGKMDGTLLNGFGVGFIVGRRDGRLALIFAASTFIFGVLMIVVQMENNIIMIQQ